MSDYQLDRLPLLSRVGIDRAEAVRTNPQALKEGWATAKILRVDPRGRVSYTDAALVFDRATDHSVDPDPHAVFLGIAEGVHIWAIRDASLTENLRDIRLFADYADDFTASVLGSALALLNWHDQAAHYAVDGTPTLPHKAGWSRRAESGAEEFPRIDPAIICLVHDGADRVVLARQHTWPHARFSLLAGFVEAGESLERCVAREILEEVGLEVENITYLGSQPWPFPRSLMLGFTATANPDQPFAFTDGEIAEANWYTRDEVKEALTRGDWSHQDPTSALLLPNSISIARIMLESWARSA